VPLAFRLTMRFGGSVPGAEGRNDGAPSPVIPASQAVCAGAGEGSDELHDGGSGGLERNPVGPLGLRPARQKRQKSALRPKGKVAVPLGFGSTPQKKGRALSLAQRRGAADPTHGAASLSSCAR
jgi:hypothetical protein